MTTVPLTRRRQGRESLIVMGLFMAVGGAWQLSVVVSSGGIDVWFAFGLLAVGLWTFVDCWKGARGVHALEWEADHVTISSDGKTVFDGAFHEIKTVVGDQLGYDLHLGTFFVYRVKSANVSDELRALLDAACAS
ncbi:hypothetical protein [Prosthecobacter sp.]|uniref:hypothetical protein n=1 Tax=Prosthecobacter sp. TaxID=1965333 RepID=UPI002ABC6DA5|nr:hypothetical protein [Prosthecobacter sp.]MDZ4405981.1 hypothetical protein [Prosthecobacter sp.]